MIYQDRISSEMEEKALKTSGKLFLVSDIDTSILKSMPYEYRKRKMHVVLTCDEFTCVCPFSGLPDFAVLTIDYVPRKMLVELKSLKYYLIAFRNVKVYNEHAVNKILEDLVELLKPHEMLVSAEFTSRGGIKNRSYVSYKSS